MVNAGTTNIDTTVNEYLSVSVTFNNASNNNILGLQILSAYVY